MRTWPLPSKNHTKVPRPGQQGGFWESRGDRFHAGVDLYAMPGSEVRAIEDGVVLDVVPFTSPEIIHYWNPTVAVLVQTKSGLIQRYAELADACVMPNDHLKSGDLIGHVGLVLNPDEIGSADPQYIQKLKAAGLPSMLHFELHQSQPSQEDYLGGNYFTSEKPASLLDPTAYLDGLTGE